MINHTFFGSLPFSRSRALQGLIATGQIKLSGNKKLKIYGTLKCASGKRMKVQNRVFFKNEQDALENTYRPCGNCMPQQYKLWKLYNATIST